MTRPSAAPLERILDVIYRIEQAPDAWLAGVLDVLRPALDQGLGLCGYFADCSSPDTFRASGFQGPPGSEEGFRRWTETLPDAVLVRSHLAIKYGRHSAMFPVYSGEEIELTATSSGFRDSIGINALDDGHRGVCIAALSERLIPPLSAATNQLLELVWLHAARAARLVTAAIPVASAPTPAPIALEPSLGREALREVAFRATIEQPRALPTHAAAAWEELAARRLILLDRFDRGGRRYHVVAQLAPAMRALDTLSPREAEVVRLAADGLANKAIGYELGISTSAVGTLMSRALAKVGASSRLSLIAAWRGSAGDQRGAPMSAASSVREATPRRR